MFGVGRLFLLQRRIGDTTTLSKYCKILLADLVGVSPELVEYWEQGRREPTRVAGRLLDHIVADPQRYLASLVKRRTVA
jgi:hypothetical protein